MNESEKWNGTERRETWYSNKDIFEMVQELREEMKETRQVIREYNGLRKDLNWAVECINKIHVSQDERSSFVIGLREWGGWIVALAVLLLQLWQ